jgi:hypothetical protein
LKVLSAVSGLKGSQIVPQPGALSFSLGIVALVASRVLPERGPFPHGRDCEVPDRLSQERHVTGNQQEPERQHPDAKHR